MSNIQKFDPAELRSHFDPKRKKSAHTTLLNWSTPFKTKPIETTRKMINIFLVANIIFAALATVSIFPDDLKADARSKVNNLLNNAHIEINNLYGDKDVLFNALIDYQHFTDSSAMNDEGAVDTSASTKMESPFYTARYDLNTVLYDYFEIVDNGGDKITLSFKNPNYSNSNNITTNSKNVEIDKSVAKELLDEKNYRSQAITFTKASISIEFIVALIAIVFWYIANRYREAETKHCHY